MINTAKMLYNGHCIFCGQMSVIGYLCKRSFFGNTNILLSNPTKKRNAVYKLQEHFNQLEENHRKEIPLTFRLILEFKGDFVSLNWFQRILKKTITKFPLF
jgi:hypothetical protein